jgi:hypothetical protein
MRAGLSFEDASRWAAYFVDVRGRLHGEVFYGLMYEEGEHRPLMEKAREYLELVEKLIFQFHVLDSCGHEGPSSPFSPAMNGIQSHTALAPSVPVIAPHSVNMHWSF